MKNRIAFISEHASPLALIGGVDSGGQNIYVAKLAAHLARQGFLVDVFTRNDNPALREIEEYEPGVRIINITAGPVEPVPKEYIFPYMDSFASAMIYFIESNKLNYELIHAHFWMSGYVAAMVKNILSIPFIITFHALGRIRRFHQGEDDGFPDIRFSIEENIVKQADAIIAECPQDKEDLIVHYMANSSKIHIIPCGFDSKEFYPMNKYKSKLELGINPETFTILQLGRMVKRKGIDNAVLGVSQFYKQKPISTKLIIVGGESDEPDPQQTPEIGRLMEIAKGESIADLLLFTGRKSRELLKLYYNAADIFITTPWYEPFGITPLEAMACGTPVIGSNVGGIKFSIVHNETGFLVPPNDSELLGKRILELYENKSLMRKFSLNSVRRVNTYFTWEKISKMMSNVYFEVIQTQKPIIVKLQNSFYEFFTSIGKSKPLKEENMNSL